MKEKKKVEQIPPVESDEEALVIDELNKRLLAAGIIKKVGNPKGLANFLKYEPLELPGEPVTKILCEERDRR